MSIDFEPERQRYRVRWREARRQRSRRFASRAEAESFAASLTAPTPAPPATSAARSEPDGGGVYSYATAAGTRWRCVFRQSDGSLTTRRGFSSRGSAVAARRTAIEQVRRGEVRASRETFAEFWATVLEAKRPYVTAGTLQDYATQGRKRLRRASAPLARRLRPADVVVLHATGHRGRPGHRELRLIQVVLRLTCSELPDGAHTHQA